MKILVTGGAGFIGAHTARALVERGEEVVLLDSFSDLLYSPELKQMRLDSLFPKGEARPKVIVGSILDDDLLARVFQEERFDKVLHLAAHANPALSIKEPEQYTLVNVDGTLNVLKESAKHDIIQFIFAGSSSVYNDEQTPFQEDSNPLRPRSPYGASKAAAELYCAVWHEMYELPITVLRLFSVYGPWGRPDMAPMIFAEQILNDEQVEVTEDRARDFTYIDDAVAGIMAALERKFDFELINIGRGQAVPLEDFANAVGKAAKKQVSLRTRPSPPGEMKITYADIRKAKELLGWEPHVSVEEGTRRLIDWMKAER